MSSFAANIVSSQRRTPSSTRMIFNMEIKPKGPPSFSGRIEEDVDTWLAKIEDFIYLTEANKRQQVAYMATLLEDAAADWWFALLKERGGSRPADFAEMSELLKKRFGSITRVDEARAQLRNIYQGQNETARAYSTRFGALLAKLPTFDNDWAKSQYIWGLYQQIAELVTISDPADLHEAIHKAERVEMARNFVSGIQGQSSRRRRRGGRGQHTRGRGRVSSVHRGVGPIYDQSGQTTQQFSMVQQSNFNQSRLRPRIQAVQCFKCQGWGHRYHQCPSKFAVQYDGGVSNEDQNIQKRLKTAQSGTTMQCVSKIKIKTEIC